MGGEQIEVLRLLASSLHEVVALIPYEGGCLGQFSEILRFFLTTSNKSI